MMQSGMLAPWGARPHVAGDLSQVWDLALRAGDGPLDWRSYRWRHLAAPAAHLVPTVWYADTGNRLVGQYATSLQPFQLGREAYQVMQGETMLVDPDYREQPLIEELAAEALLSWRAATIPFLIHLRPTATPLKATMGWEMLFSMAWLWRPLRPGVYMRHHDFPGSMSAIASVVGRLGHGAINMWVRLRGRGVRILEIERPDERFNLLWERLRFHHTALMVRDRDWLDYRYYFSPTSDYQILLAERRGEPTGYLIYRLTEQQGLRTGWIVDLFSSPNDSRSRSALLRATLARLYRAGAVTVRLLVARRTALERWFRALGFLPGREMQFVSLLPFRDDLPLSVLRDPNQFYLMAGDFDVL